MIGSIFGRWTVVSASDEKRNRKRMWLCRCMCGTERLVVAGNLRSGVSKSCGCLHLENIHAKRFRHGRNTADRTYQSWSSMRDRCNNPRNAKFHRYGGRGIRVCERWNSFENFLADMGECPPEFSIERMNNDGHYEKDNCKWASRREQSLNKSTTRRVTAFGQTKPLTVWAEETGLPFLMIWKRLARGWTPERAMTQPKIYPRKSA